MKQKFKDKKFSAEAMDIVNLCCQIIDRYQEQGYTLSLRQLYYQLVSANAVPNTEASYKKIGDILTDARMAGLCDWDMIEDRNRSTITPPHWDSPSDIIDSAARSYRIDKWDMQPCYCEVMVEKQALEGVLEPVCRQLDVPFTSNKGYSSVTLMHEAGQRMMEQFRKRCIKNGLMPGEYKNRRHVCFVDDVLLSEGNELIEKYTPVRLTKKAIKDGWPVIKVFYLGDHDPSGIDMTRDVRDRLQLFSDLTPIEVERLALNMAQIDELNPPENPAKMTDSRANEYVRKFGRSSWELDAVQPDALAALVRNAVIGFRNEKLWKKAVSVETEQRAHLEDIAKKLRK